MLFIVSFCFIFLCGLFTILLCIIILFSFNRFVYNMNAHAYTKNFSNKKIYLLLFVNYFILSL